jgi:pyridoxal 5-phosphate dependent beta-lyase
VDAPSAIVGVRAASGQDVTAARVRLLDEHGIVTTACTILRAPWT